MIKGERFFAFPLNFGECPLDRCGIGCACLWGGARGGMLILLEFEGRDVREDRSENDTVLCDVRQTLPSRWAPKVVVASPCEAEDMDEVNSNKPQLLVYRSNVETKVDSNMIRFL